MRESRSPPSFRRALAETRGLLLFVFLLHFLPYSPAGGGGRCARGSAPPAFPGDGRLPLSVARHLQAWNLGKCAVAAPLGCGKAEATGADMKVRGVDVSRSGSAGVAAICLRHAGAFFLVLLVRAKECLAPFLGRCAFRYR